MEFSPLNSLLALLVTLAALPVSASRLEERLALVLKVKTVSKKSAIGNRLTNLYVGRPNMDAIRQSSSQVEFSSHFSSAARVMVLIGGCYHYWLPTSC
jgi:hypothetical protein